jgi:NADPH-dependent 2,4-dienoyl-CoA reductase/sulfur reductase-like enzyme
VTRRLVVIGAGPIGLCAALSASERGFDVTVLERDAVLRPIAARLAGRVHVRHEVIAVARAGMSRRDYAGHPIRGERGFRVLVATPGGERELEAEAVLDASGASLPAPIVARGERGERGAAMIRTLGALLARRGALAGKRVAVIGHGHSAANALILLASVAAEAPETRVVWVVRSLNRRPCVEVASDPLPERARIVSRANELAAQPPAWLTVERRARVLAVGADGLELSGGRRVAADEVVALVGMRPDLAHASELALDISPVTEGAGGLARALANVTDCLSVPRLSPADLASGEPGFHLVGAASYGRASTFLLASGYAQVETILDNL